MPRLFKVDFPGPITVYSDQKDIKVNNFEILPKTEDPFNYSIQCHVKLSSVLKCHYNYES